MFQDTYVNIAITSAIASVVYIVIYYYQHSETPKINLVFSMVASIGSIYTAGSLVYALKFSNKPAIEILMNFQLFAILAIISVGLYSVVVLIDTIKMLKKSS